MLVGTNRALPNPCERAERAEVGERVVAAFGFGVDVRAVRAHVVAHRKNLVNQRRVSSSPHQTKLGLPFGSPNSATVALSFSGYCRLFQLWPAVWENSG